MALRDGDHLPLEAVACVDPTDEARWEIKGVARAVLGRVYAWQDTLFVPDVQADENIRAEIEAYDLDVTSLIGLPMGGEAGLYLDRGTGDAPFTPGDAHLAAAHATILGRSLTLTAQQEALRRRQSNLDILLSLLARPEALGAAELLDQVAEMTRRIARGDRAFVLLLHEGELTFAAGRDRDGALAPTAFKQLSRSVCDKVLETRCEVCVLDTGTNDEFASRLSVVNLRLQGIVAVPLMGKEGPLGLLYVDSRTKALGVLERDMQDLLAASKVVSLLIGSAF